MTTLGARLVRRLRVQGFPLPASTWASARVVYTRAGRHQRAAGAWRWHLAAGDQPLPVGGWFTVAELLAAPALRWTVDEFGDTTVEQEAFDEPSQLG